MHSSDREKESFFHTYKRLPLEIERGDGVSLYTKEGQQYLDMFGGLAVNALGYAHPKILEAINTQSKKYIHLSNYFLQEPQIQLAEILMKESGYSKIFFSNSGTEAIEGAIKLARKWGSTKGKGELVSFSNAFHGRTYGALSLMDRPNYKEGYAPFLPGCTISEFNNIEKLNAAVSGKTCAVVLESIQGEGGICPVSPAFAAELQQLKLIHGFLIIADEIQGGIGRTGKLFSFQHFGLEPDIIVIAKPLGGGLPLGAFLGNETVADVLTPGAHGTTFGGNPVACAAGIVTLQEILHNGLMQNAARIGALLKSKLLDLQNEFPTIIREVRGEGLMVGVDLNIEGEGIVTTLREKYHILINCTNRTVLRLLPPLIINEQHVEQTVIALRDVFTQGI